MDFGSIKIFGMALCRQETQRYSHPPSTLSWIASGLRFEEYTTNCREWSTLQFLTISIVEVKISLASQKKNVSRILKGPLITPLTHLTHLTHLLKPNPSIIHLRSSDTRPQPQRVQACGLPWEQRSIFQQEAVQRWSDDPMCTWVLQFYILSSYIICLPCCVVKNTLYKCPCLFCIEIDFAKLSLPNDCLKKPTKSTTNYMTSQWSWGFWTVPLFTPQFKRKYP